MNLLFVHQNFPGQYLHVARHMAAAGHKVLSIGQSHSAALPGVAHFRYAPKHPAVSCHSYLTELDGSTRNGLCVAEICHRLLNEGFTPDLVVGHGGWGETMFIKDVWPATPMLAYCEFYYRPTGSDIDFDPEFPPSADIAFRLRMRGAANLISLDAADRGQTPTHWQLSQFPTAYQSRIDVVHDGIDTDLARPDKTARLWLSGGAVISAGDPVITYVARNLEPYRGFHVFMRALPEILAVRPDARVLIVGGNDVSYGPPPDDYQNWRAKMTAELAEALDWTRVHFLGNLEYRQYLMLLRVSAVHVYMTYPFVLSWSCLEAMSSGCRMVASRTPPVAEVIEDGGNGCLFDFFNSAALSAQVLRALGENSPLDPLRLDARRTILERYDLRRICLPRLNQIFNEMVLL